MNKQTLAKAIGATIGLYPLEITNMLVSNGVILNANNITFQTLVDSTINGLSSSAKFYKDFEAFFNANENNIMSNINNQ
jgi:hypothetical protein